MPPVPDSAPKRTPWEDAVPRAPNDTALIELILAAPLDQLATAARFLVPRGRAALPALEARIAKWSAAPYRDGREAVLLSLGLATILRREPFPAEHEGLLTEAMRAVGLESESHPVIAELRLVVARLPEARREAVVFGERSLDASGRGHLLWAFAGVCPTPRVIAACIEETLGWKRAEFDRAPARREVVEECFRLFGSKASPLLAEALLGPASKAPQRHLLVRALAQAPSPESAPALASMLGDPGASRSALEGLRALGSDVVAHALRSHPVALQKKVQKALTPAKEKAPARVAGAACVTPPSAEEQLARMKRELSSAEVDAVWAALDVDHHDAPEVRARAMAAARRDPRAVVALAQQFLPALARGEEQLHGLDLDFFFAACALPHPALPFLVAELLAACPERGGVRIKEALHRAGEVIGPALGPALARSVPPLPSPARRHYLTWLVEHAPGHAVEAFASAAEDAILPHRELAARGLVRAGPMTLSIAVRLLKRGPEAREVGAEVLRALPDAASVSALEAVLKSERDARLRTLLEGALNACLAGTQPELSESALDKAFAARAPEGPARAPKLPAPQWKGGKTMSASALRWLLASLEAEATTPPDAELRTVRARLEEKSCAALAKAILASFPDGAEQPWALTQLAVLGSDAQLDALGASLAERVTARGANHAAFGTEALKRSGRLGAIRWLDHWTRHGSARLRRDSREALEDLARDRASEIDDLVDDAFTLSRGADLECDALHLRERLEIALLTGRAWTPPRFEELFVASPVGTRAAAGLVFASSDGDAFALDARGRRIALDARKLTPLRASVRLAHPIEHAPDALASWRAALTKKKLVPPFTQLEREAPAHAPEALAALVARAVLPTRALLNGLEALGYRRGEPGEAGLVFEATREIGRARLVVEHEGISVSDGRNPLGPTARLLAIHVRTDDGSPTSERLQAEAARDLTWLLRG